MIDQPRGTGPKTEQARRLVAARLRAGFGHAKNAAERFGWVYESYIQHERGQRGIKWSVAKKYADAFGVPHPWLMAEAGAPEPDPAPVSGSHTMAVAARPDGRPQAALGMWPKDIARKAKGDRALLEEAARRAIEFALLHLNQPAGLSDAVIQRLAEFAAQRVLAGRAETALAEEEAAHIPRLSGDDKA